MRHGSDSFVAIGCLAASKTPGDQLIALGLGSCIGVAVWCEASGTVGVAHVYLPSSIGAQPSDERPAKYADLGVPALIDAVVSLGADREKLKAFLVGGAQMFEFESRMGGASGNGSVGMRNDVAVRDALAAAGVPVVGADTGGVSGRSMRISPGATEVTIVGANKGTAATLVAVKATTARTNTVITGRVRAA